VREPPHILAQRYLALARYLDQAGKDDPGAVEAVPSRDFAAHLAIIEKLEDPNAPPLTYGERLDLAEAARKVWLAKDKAGERQRKLETLEWILERNRQGPPMHAERASTYKLLTKGFGFKTLAGLHQFLKRERKVRKRTKTR
jgi:hypothetical protein